MFIEREKTLHLNSAIITFFRDSSFLITNKITFVHTIFLDLDNYFGFFDLCFNSWNIPMGGIFTSISSTCVTG